MKCEVREVRVDEQKLVQQIKYSLRFLRKEYPGFSQWFETKVKTQLGSGARRIYIAYPLTDEDKIAGVMILKDTIKEKKICTLCVFPEYHRQGIGHTFLQLAIDVLKTTQPLITVSDIHKEEFDPLFKEFGFKYEQSYLDYYTVGMKEHAYNGALNCQQFQDVSVYG